MSQYGRIMLITAPLVVLLQIILHYLLFIVGLPAFVKYVHFNIISLIIAPIIMEEGRFHRGGSGFPDGSGPNPGAAGRCLLGLHGRVHREGVNTGDGHSVLLFDKL
jgi:hypothetical protein